MLPLLLSFSLPAFGQESNLLQKFRYADSVIIVSHESLVLSGPPGKPGIRLELVKENKPDYSIIREIKKLDKISIDSLTGILLSPNNDRDINTVFCFEPHHAVFIFSGELISYFDLCFACRRFVTTKDIAVSERILSSQVWHLLESFFRNRQIIFELPSVNLYVPD